MIGRELKTRNMGQIFWSSELNHSLQHPHPTGEPVCPDCSTLDTTPLGKQWSRAGVLGPKLLWWEIERSCRLWPDPALTTVLISGVKEMMEDLSISPLRNCLSKENKIKKEKKGGIIEYFSTLLKLIKDL